MVTKVTMNKHRSTWVYTAHNEQGGSFGSNHSGSKKVALHMATRGVKPGEFFELVTNGKSEGAFTVSDGKVVKA